MGKKVLLGMSGGIENVESYDFVQFLNTKRI